jgi:hypothetical protein
MQRHRPVPGIANLSQNFARKESLPIQSPVSHPQQLIDAGDDSQDLAQEIYARLALDYLRDHQVPEPRVLQELAKRARVAAQSYFEVQP